MAAITDAPRDGLGGDPDAVIRELYSHYAKALLGYVEQFCPDRASADDIVQETFIRAWRHLPQLSVDDRPVRPWLFRVARNLLIDANRAERARPMTVQGQAAGEVATDSGLEEILDRQLVSAALQHLSPAHQTVLRLTVSGFLPSVLNESAIAKAMWQWRTLEAPAVQGSRPGAAAAPLAVREKSFFIPNERGARPGPASAAVPEGGSAVRR